MPAARPLALALAAALLAGCADAPVAPTGPEGRAVVLDLRPLFRTADGQEPCASVVDSLALVVTEEGGTRRTYRRRLTPEAALVVIPVEVAPGAATFAAEVRSNNGARLYAGSTSADVEEDDFSVEVEVAAVNAVVKACPDVVPLTFSDGPYRGTFFVINRGSRQTAWEADVDPPLCDGEPCFCDGPCFWLDPPASVLAPGDTVEVAAHAYDVGAETFAARVHSSVGALNLRFAIAGRRAGAAPSD